MESYHDQTNGEALIFKCSECNRNVLVLHSQSSDNLGIESCYLFCTKCNKKYCVDCTKNMKYRAFVDMKNPSLCDNCNPEKKYYDN